MTLLLVDNSVLQRLSRAPSVADAVRRRIEMGDSLCSSPSLVLEAGFSARSAADHTRIVNSLTADFQLLHFTPEIGQLAVELQASLFAVGMGRAVGVMDLLTAAAAVWHDAVVLHHDADFEHLAAADGRVHQSWVVPRGTVD